MNKYEILEKCRSEKSDEGMIEAENKGRMAGMIAFCIVFLIICIFNLFTGQDNFVASTLFTTFLAAEAYPKYQFTKNKSYLVTTLALSLSACASFLSYILQVMR